MVNEGGGSSRRVSTMSLVLLVLAVIEPVGVAATGNWSLALGSGIVLAGLSLIFGAIGRTHRPARIAMIGSLLLLVVGGWVAARKWHHETHTDVTAWLRIRRPALEDIDRKKADAASGEYRRAQILMIKSPEILAAAIRRQGITELDTIRAQEDPVSWLADRIRVVWRENSEIIKVNMTGVRRGREAIDAAKIVNAIVSTYLDQVVETGRVVVLEEATP